MSSPLGETGSALVLVPAGFLVLVILGALAVDSAVSYLGQQQLHNTLVAAGNDAASAGLDNSQFYRSGAVVISAQAAGQVVCQSLAAQGGSQLHDVRLWMAVRGRFVRIDGVATVDAVFGRAVPGFGTRRVRASVQAVAVRAARQPAAASNPAEPRPTATDLLPLDCG